MKPAMAAIAVMTVMSTASAVTVATAPAASADTELRYLGQQGELVNGDIVQGWTVWGLEPSTDTIPYPVAGTLWEASATDEAISGAVTPIVSNLNARAESGQTYRVLFGVATPQGVNPATLAEGEETTGKIYFDVTGDAPDSVVYNAGGPDLLVWVEAPPPPPVSETPSGYTAPARSATAPAEPETAETPAEGTEPAESAPGATPADSTGALPPEGAAADVPTGSSGTPLPEGSTGTPLPEGSTGTPLPEPAAPAPAAVAPATPEGSSGTPLPEGGTAEVPTGSSGTPLPEGQQVVPPAAEQTPVTTTVVAPPPAS